MIVEYHRPADLQQALTLLGRAEPRTLPLAGGTVVSRRLRDTAQSYAVVDLQNLGLNSIRREGQLLYIGAAATLQQVYECGDLPEALRQSLLIEAALNQRQMASVAGTIISCDGRSAFVTALLALDPRIEWAGQEETEPLGDYLALKPSDPLQAATRLMTAVRVALNVELRFESVARAPLDRPVVCAAAARWPSGRTRLTLGGWGNAPILAMDGPEAAGANVAARSAYRTAEDQWASAEYRADVAATLAARLTK